MMQTGVDRAAYSKMVEQRPSMFTNEGKDFKEWAARCNKWWESFRGSSTFRKKVIIWNAYRDRVKPNPGAYDAPGSDKDSHEWHARALEWAAQYGVRPE